MNDAPNNPAAAQDPASMSEEQILQAIRSGIQDNQIMIFMKGTPDFPMCGFSGRAVEILKSFGVPFAAMNILVDPRIRNILSGVSNWPTIPQIFLGGEFIGGCDILVELHEKGELEPMIRQAAGSSA